MVGSYSRHVFDMHGNGGTAFEVTDYFTPQLQAAIGFFKWVELGVSIPVHIVAGNRSYGNGDGFKSPDNDPNKNNALGFSGTSGTDRYRSCAGTLAVLSALRRAPPAHRGRDDARGRRTIARDRCLAVPRLVMTLLVIPDRPPFNASVLRRRDTCVLPTLVATSDTRGSHPAGLFVPSGAPLADFAALRLPP